jgi:hypothetical protein
MSLAFHTSMTDVYENYDDTSIKIFVVVLLDYLGRFRWTMAIGWIG